MTEYPWWEEVEAAAPLRQGDIIETCPVAMFKEDVKFDAEANLDGLLKTLSESVGVQQVRSVVMTQACDLEQLKVRNVILCPIATLEEFESEWKARFEAENGKKPSASEWKSMTTRVKAGRVWNLALLRKREPADDVELTRPTTVVDFHEVFSLPLAFLQLWVAKSGTRRLRLAPPYREHLSQAFARFFMRVGLPVDIGEL